MVVVHAPKCFRSPNLSLLQLMTLLSVLGSTPASAASWAQDLVSAATERTQTAVTYDAGYRALGYPGGDVPNHLGVCTDLVIRAYRVLGLDLQQVVHEDMTQNFAQYPSKRIWGLNQPDANIDHRRVPNLQRYFEGKGAALETSGNSEDYLPGDLVTWMLPGNLPHIGIVSDAPVAGGAAVRKIIHNIGRGPEITDILFKYPITGHYRLNPEAVAEYSDR